MSELLGLVDKLPTCDRQLAEDLVCATDSDAMIGAENVILDRLDVSLDETARGLSYPVVRQIEAFVSEQIERPWTYAELPESVRA